MSEQESVVIYNVVVNHEEQYSLWPAERENAPGWRDAGFRGTKDECMAYVRQHWTDMRPLSLRLQMEARQQAAAASASNTAGTIPEGNVAVADAPPVAASIAVADTPDPAQPAPESAIVETPPPPSQIAGDTSVTNTAGDQKQNKGFFGRLFGRK